MSKLQQILGSHPGKSSNVVQIDDGRINPEDYNFGQQKYQVQQMDAQNSYNPSPMSQAKSCPLGERSQRQLTSGLKKYNE